MGLRICISKFPGGADATENDQDLACWGVNQLAGGVKGTQTDGCGCSLKGERERERLHQNIQQKIETRRKKFRNVPLILPNHKIKADGFRVRDWQTS